MNVEYTREKVRGALSRGPRAVPWFRVASGLAMGVTLASAQGQAVPARPPLDVNAPREVERPKPKGDAPDAGVQAAPDDGPVYRVSRFVARFRTDHPGNPSLASVLEAPVRLSVLPSGYAAPRPGLPTVTPKVADVIEGTANAFHQSGLNAVARGVSESLNQAGYFGVFTQIDPDDIDNQTGEDLRGRERSELRLIIWLPKVSGLRTIGSGERLAEEGAPDQYAALINSPDRVHTRVRAQSPVQPGDVLRKDLIDEYIFRLNRHPGRNVGATIAPAGGPEDPEAVSIDYNLTEGKPWIVYAQVSNTGTKQTEEWRQRFGFTHNQVSGYDDVLRFDYITGNFKDSHALAGSYEFPILSDRIRTRLFGVYSQFDASNVGQAGEQFSGNTIQVGGELSALAYQDGAFFVDVMGGARWQRVSVTDELFGFEGEGDFVIPYAGARFERDAQAWRASGGATLELSLSSVDQLDLDLLGRRAADDTWIVLRYDAEYSAYLEPLLYPESWSGRAGPKGPGMTLAHEAALSLKGQYAFGNRLIAQEQAVVGGLYSVRGYDESVAAGDDSIILSAEYRFHLPRSLEVSEPGKIGERTMTDAWPMGAGFRWAPQQPYGVTDWDLILKGFVDVGATSTNDPLLGEFDNTLVGAGVGVELQFKRHVNLRLDWGVAMADADAAGGGNDAGDNRFHFVLTFLY